MPCLFSWRWPFQKVDILKGFTIPWLVYLADHAAAKAA